MSHSKVFWRKHTNHISDKGLAPTIYKQKLKFNNKTNNAIKKWAKIVLCFHGRRCTDDKPNT